MLERFFERLLVALIGFWLCMAAIQVLVSIGRRAGDFLLRLVPGLFASLVATVVVGAFFVGMLVRLHDRIARRDPGSERLRMAEARRATAVREPAEDVPAFGVTETIPEDPDPALDPLRDAR